VTSWLYGSFSISMKIELLFLLCVGRGFFHFCFYPDLSDFKSCASFRSSVFTVLAGPALCRSSSRRWGVPLVFGLLLIAVFHSRSGQGLGRPAHEW
jgi:hypothetical protein